MLAAVPFGPDHPSHEVELVKASTVGPNISPELSGVIAMTLLQRPFRSDDRNNEEICEVVRGVALYFRGVSCGVNPSDRLSKKNRRTPEKSMSILTWASTYTCRFSAKSGLYADTLLGNEDQSLQYS